MILPDSVIEKELDIGRLDVEPVDLDSQLQPASLDLRLGKEFVDVRHDHMRVADDSFVFEPCMHGNFYLGQTKERIEIPDYLGVKVHGRSSIARKGLAVHITGGWVDPGFHGQLTLEMANFTNRRVEIPIGQRICQLTFHLLMEPAEEPYYEKEDAKYAGQSGVTRSRLEDHER